VRSLLPAWCERVARRVVKEVEVLNDARDYSKSKGRATRQKEMRS